MNDRKTVIKLTPSQKGLLRKFYNKQPKNCWLLAQPGVGLSEQSRNGRLMVHAFTRAEGLIIDAAIQQVFQQRKKVQS